MGSPATLIATHSGIRGRPGAELSAEVVERTIGRFAQMLAGLGGASAIAVARDERESSARLAAAAIEAGLACALDVVDLGVASSPAAKLAARNRGLEGAVIITGSHLDPALNGLKLVAAPSYAPLDPSRLPEAGGRASRRGGVNRDGGAAGEHAEAVRSAVNADAVRDAALTVRCEGGAGEAPRLLFDALGCEQRGTGFDVGLRLDADADRLVLLDESGAELDTELVLPLVMLARGARRIVKGADTSRMVDALARERGGFVHTVPPGELHLAEGLVHDTAELAGEGNGGVIVPAVGPGRDGLAAAAAVLSLVAQMGRPLSELAGDLPRRPMRRSTRPCTDPAQAHEALAVLARRVGGELGSPLDGVLVERGEAWGLVRSSATEPVIRVTVEAPTEQEATALHEELVDALGPLPAAR